MLRRGQIQLLVMGVLTIGLPSAHAAPTVGGLFPNFSASDLAGQLHRNLEFVGRPTLLLVGSTTSASESLKGWAQVAERELPKTARRYTLLAFSLSPMLLDSTVFAIARSRTPEALWHSSWLERDGVLQQTLGIVESDVAFAFVLDASGRVTATAHSSVAAPGAEKIWLALQAAAPLGTDPK